MKEGPKETIGTEDVMGKNVLTQEEIRALLADDLLIDVKEKGWTGRASKKLADEAREEEKLLTKKSFSEDPGKRREEESLRFFPDVLNSLGEAVIITDARGRVEYMNVMAQNLTGWSLSEAANQSVSSVFRLQNGRTGDPKESPAEICFRKGNAGRGTDHTILCHSSGTEYLIEYSAALIRDDEGQIRGRVVVFRDVTEKRNLLLEMTRQAHFDALTDLPNRYLFKDRFSQAIARARRNGHPLVLYYLDLDHFKKVNDTLGHPTGDRVLRETARRLRLAVRETDTVARMGGDEFAILAGDMQSKDDAVRFAGKVRDAIIQPLVIFGKEHQLTASIGAAFYPFDGNSLTLLSRNADLAMYRAKKKGRNRIQFFSSFMLPLDERRALNLDPSVV